MESQGAGRHSSTAALYSCGQGGQGRPLCDKTQDECYKCLKKGHHAHECRGGAHQGGRRSKSARQVRAKAHADAALSAGNTTFSLSYRLNVGTHAFKTDVEGE